MRPWFIDSVKQGFPTLEAVILRIMTEIDKSALELNVQFGKHGVCVRDFSKALRDILSDDRMNPLHLVSAAEGCQDHIGKVLVGAKLNGKTWNDLMQVVVWDSLKAMVITLSGAAGHGVQQVIEGRQFTVIGCDAVAYGLAGMLTQLGALKHLIEHKTETIEKSVSGVESLADIPGIVGLHISKPQWLVDMVDEDLPEGAPKLSTVLFSSKTPESKIVATTIGNA